MLIRDMDKTTLRVKVISAEEVKARITNHVAGRHLNVLIPTQVVGTWFGCIIDAVVVVVRDRKATLRTHRMICHIMHICRKETLIIIVHLGGNIGPPEKGLCVRGAVKQARLEFDQGTARLHTNTMHPLQAIQRIMLRHPDGL